MLLLHYSQVVLYEILPGEFYQHHLLLVEAAFLLLLDGIEDKEVDKACCSYSIAVLCFLPYMVQCMRVHCNSVCTPILCTRGIACDSKCSLSVVITKMC